MSKLPARAAIFALAALVLRAEAPDQGARAGEPDPGAIADLRVFETQARARLDLARPPSSETDLGADPWVLAPAPRAGLWLGALRGRSALVLLDRDLHERARVAAPRSAQAIAVSSHGEIVVGGELSRELWRYALAGDALVLRGKTPLDGVHGVRDLAFGGDGVLYALDEVGARVIALAGDRRVDTAACRGASQLAIVARRAVVNCPLEHAIVVFDLERGGALREAARLRNDGPFWGFDAKDTADGLVVAAGGIEDHALDRSGGFFGYIDSFVYVFRVAGDGARRIASVNVSEHGVVTPKAIALEPPTKGSVVIDVAAFGSAAAARVTLETSGLHATGNDAGGAPLAHVATLRGAPGVRALVRAPDGAWLGANPLLDRWVVFESAGVTTREIPGERGASDVSVRIGEALVFTTLMAPANTSEGAHSRFSCEACHFEGYGDGRRHHTGRGDVYATTKPLLGLAGNKPHFTRALDPDMAQVAMNEFRVAGAGNPHDPWFSIDVADHPWLRELGVREPTLSPEALRRAFTTFLLAFSHRPNPVTLGRNRFDDRERRGAALFETRCERCHASRLAADDAASRVPPSKWEATILSPTAPIVWARAGYEKTGIEPYVHPDGARPSSLRRLAKKAPYFTSGEARSLDDVLRAARVGPTGAFAHRASASALAPLTDDEREVLAAFLRLL